MPLDKPKTYHSYLIRCWASTPSAPGSMRARFVVEAITEEPQRWGFDTFDELVAFLRVALLEDAPEQHNGPPNDAGG